MAKKIGIYFSFMTPEQKQRLRRMAQGWEIVELEEGFDPNKISDCEIIFGRIPESYIPYCRELKWLQSRSVGVDNYLKSEQYPFPEEVVLTNAAGAYGTVIAEHMVTVTLMLLRNMVGYINQQKQGLWKVIGKVRSVAGSRVCVLGLGDIGSKFARHMHEMGASVVGVKRTPCPPSEYIERVYASDAMEEAVQGADIIAVSLPATKDTVRVVDAQLISKMKDGAIIINVGRGDSIDQDALMEGLRCGKLAGAALDVTTPEPLPPEHPLWQMEQVIITPHSSGANTSDLTLYQIGEVFLKNLSDYLAGRPFARVVNRSLGY